MSANKVTAYKVCDSRSAAAAIRPGITKRYRGKQECFIVLHLNTANAVIGRPQMVALGTVDSLMVAPRDVFREAIKRNARSIIVAHNHISGTLVPSSEDYVLTARLHSAAELLGITLLDHIILSDTSASDTAYRSLADMGRLEG